MGLLEKLKAFKGAKEDELDNIFKNELAPAFLYGGYISVKDWKGCDYYRIYLRTIEFYFHTEDGCEFTVEDNIMYHTNKNGVYNLNEGKDSSYLPYLPIMSINPHSSGYDITFENEDKKYRASALIREYAIYDVNNRRFLKWDTSLSKFVLCYCGEIAFNNQSTYLQKVFTGFSLSGDGVSPLWVDTNETGEVLDGQPRKGILNDKHRWRFTRKNDITRDALDTDNEIVYLSEWLNDSKEGHPKFFSRLVNLFDSLNIKWDVLKCTNDYWVRDFMPFQTKEGKFVKYKYKPDYLLNSKKRRETITDCTKACEKINIKYSETDIIIDGGNIVYCGDYIVMTDKVFSENKDKNDNQFIAELESVFGNKEIIFIPWHLIGNPKDKNTDVYGHADGFIQWCGDNRVLMSNHRETDSIEATNIREILESKGFEVTEMLFDTIPNQNINYNWAYINYLRVGNIIIMPKFEIAEDEMAYDYVQKANPKCKVYQIEMKEIADEGGALHCITWNIKK